MSETTTKVSPDSPESWLSSLLSLSGVPLWILIGLSVTLVVYPTSLNPGLPLLLSSFALLVAGVLRLRYGSGRYYNYGQDVAVFLLFWFCASAMTAMNSYLAARSLYTFAGFVAVIVLLQVAVRRTWHTRMACYAFVWFNLIFALWAWQKSVSYSWATGAITHLTGQFVNPDTYSVLPTLGFLVGLGLVERMPRRFVLAFCGVLSFLLLTVLATGCRASLLGLVVGGLAFAGLLARFRQKKMDQTKFLITIPLIVIFLLLPLSALSFSVVKKYVGTLTGENLQYETVRAEVARYGWSAAARHPVLGAGPGAFGLAYQQVRPLDQDPLYVNIAHNDYIEMAVETGVVGLGLWLVLFGLAAQKTYKVVRKGRRPFLAAGLFAALCAMSVYMLFNFIVSERPALWSVGFVVGLALTFPSRRQSRPEHSLCRLSASLFLVGLSFFSFYFAAKSLVADNYLSQSKRLAQDLLHENALELLRQAIELQPHRDRLYLAAAQSAETLHSFSGASTYREQEEELLRQAIEASGHSVDAYVLLSEMKQKSGQFEEGEDLLNQALQNAPNSPHLVGKKASLLIRRGRVEEAISLLGDLVGAKQQKYYGQLKGLLQESELRRPGSTLGTLEDWLNDADKVAWASPLIKEMAEWAYKSQNWSSAQGLYRLALRENPGDTCLRVEAALVEGHVVGSEAELVRLKALMEEREGLEGKCMKKAFQRWYEVNQKVGTLEEAQTYLERQVANFPTETEYRLTLSDTYERQGRMKQAQELLREGLSRGYATAELNFRLGSLYERSEAIELAAVYYRKAVELDPNHGQAKARLEGLRK